MKKSSVLTKAAWPLLLGLSLALAGCGDSDDDSTEPQGSAGAPSGSGNSGSPANLCEDLDDPPDPVPETQMNETRPAAKGGKINPGRYNLVDFRVYPPGTADDKKRARALVLRSDGTFTHRDFSGNPPILGGTYQTKDHKLTLGVKCPGNQIVTLDYEATDDELWLWGEDEIQVYKKE